MKAIIVPIVTDYNKGDQALVWESYRLVKDTGMYSRVYLLDSIKNGKRYSQQSEKKGLEFVENILKHPRRGKVNQKEHVKESKVELILQIGRALSDLINQMFILLICRNKFLMNLFFSKRLNDSINHFREADTIFVKGGGFIHAYGEFTAPYLMWYFLFYVRLAKRLKKKVVFFPNSFGPFEGHTVKSQVKSVFKKIDLLYARERVSAEKLGDLLNQEVPVEMDLGFFLKEAGPTEAKNILRNYGFLPEDKIIGITIRPWRFPGSENPVELYKKYIDSVKKIVEYAVAENYKIALCNQSIGPNSHEDDRNAILDLLNLLDEKTKNRVIWVNEDLPCDLLKAVYSNFYFFIGTRFHSVIFSMTSKIPSIAIGYGGNKAKGIMGDFSLDDYVVQIHDVTPEKLKYMFQDAILNYDQIKSKLVSKLEIVEKSRNNIIQNIQALR